MRYAISYGCGKASRLIPARSKQNLQITRLGSLLELKTNRTLLLTASDAAGQIQSTQRLTLMLSNVAPGQSRLSRLPYDQKPSSRACVLTANELAESVVDAWIRVRAVVNNGDKDTLRALHMQAKRADTNVDGKTLHKDLLKLQKYFPEPSCIQPEKISPVLIPVGAPRTLEGKLFRLCRASWSMPFSKGYGRRLRFLVFDEHHEAVIGIIGLQSPPADLLCRDRYFGVTKKNKLAVANTTMDAYTVGASPTYAPLLAGKLVAGFIHSSIVRKAYWRAYGGSQAIISGERLPQPLLAVTTASAFGRSSIYNRLKFDGELLARPLGFTRGFGTVHLEELYPHISAYLKERGKFIPAGFGNGPKVRWQNVIRALAELGIQRDCLEHGIAREVFIFEFASNTLEAQQNDAVPKMRDFNDKAWANHWKQRWCLARVQRNPNWASFSTYERMITAIDDLL
ncbi:hypothetical protein XarbCFBP7697_16125 [Xanthomonas arboricola]|nr:hypothetical protein XarbCFBP7697_16125 [Xanthomonas arboricola]